MAPKSGRRGVLMTASARKPRAEWREEPSEGSEDGEGASDEEALAAKASQLEWEQIEREVREEKRRIFADQEFTSGRRGQLEGVAGYDDVAGDFHDAAAPSRPAEEAEDSSLAATQSAALTEDAEPSDAPAAGGVLSTGGAVAASSPAAAARCIEEHGKRARGGKKLTARKRKKEEEAAAAADEEGEETEEAKAKRLKKQEEEEEEAKKWLRLKLDGIEKPRRIKASRVVYYYDHDSSGALFPKELPSVSTAEVAGTHSQAPAEVVSSGDGNFRASLRRDLFDDDSDGDE